MRPIAPSAGPQRFAPAVTTAPDGPPRFSIVTAVYNSPLGAFVETARSVLDQRRADWEWVLVDDGSPDPAVVEVLAELVAVDPRIRAFAREANGGIVAASNDALSEARGEFVALLDHDDVLAPNALKRMAAVLDDDVDYAYSDQDLMADDGELHTPYHKPDWAPERFRHHMYTTHFSVLRRSLVEEVGGFRPGFDGSQDHDLVLRVTERARRVVHVPAILYHWRQVEGSAAADSAAKPYAWDAGVRAVQDHLDRVGIAARVEKGRSPGQYRLVREPDLTTSVSVVIPTIGSGGLTWGRHRRMVVEAVRSVRAHSRHPDLEFVVVYDSPTPPEVLDELRALPGVRLKLVEFTEPFNFSAKCNVGALHASGEVIVFLNDDVEAESQDLLEQLIAPLREAGVGATGPKLLFPSMRIQHAGVSYGSGTISHSYYRRRHPDVPGVHNDLWINREVTALTGACIAVRRAVFEQVGGFSEQLPMNYNDVDLCLKIARSGRRLVWLHDVVLFHFESVTRSSAVAEWEMDFMRARWGDFETVREAHSNNVR